MKSLRYNEGKLRFDLIPWEFTHWLAGVFTLGAAKYAPDNWRISKGTDDHGSFIQDRLASLHRHLNAWQSGEQWDPETGQHHLLHAAWNALVIVWYEN